MIEEEQPQNPIHIRILRLSARPLCSTAWFLTIYCCTVDAIRLNVPVNQTVPKPSGRIKWSPFFTG